MGFFDSVKDKAGALAADAERAGRVTAAQARLVVLQSDLKKAERELGHAAFSLIERGDPIHPDLSPVVERVRSTAAEVHAKEREIAELRGETPAASPTGTSSETTPAAAGPATHVRSAEAETTTEAGSEPAPLPAATTVQTADGPVVVQPAEVMAAAEAEAALEADAASSPPRKTTRRKTTAKPAPAGKAPAKKPAAKKTPAGKPAKAGSTPKKASRPPSAGPRPAGKKRPADI